MSPQRSPAPIDEPTGDAWHAFAYLLTGVGIYGFLGWLADRWLHTSFLVVLGILLGAGFGTFLTWTRFNRPWQDASPVAVPAGRPTRRTDQMSEETL